MPRLANNLREFLENYRFLNIREDKNGKRRISSDKIYKDQSGEVKYFLFVTQNHWLCINNIGSSKEILATYDDLMSRNFKEPRTYNNTKEELGVKNLNFRSKSLFKDDTQFKNVYVYDLETYLHEGVSHAYACGFRKIPERNLLEKGCDLEELHREMASETQIYCGEDCIEEMFNRIDDDHEKIKVKVKKGKEGEKMEVEKKQEIFLYAHNGGNFDSLVITSTQSNLKYSNIIKCGGRILQLTVEMENTKIFVRDSASYLLGSLKRLCKDYQLPDIFSKGDFDKHEIITRENYMDFEDEWRPYLMNDVISLSLILYSFIDSLVQLQEKLQIEKHFAVKHCMSAASIAWQFYMAVVKGTPEQAVLATFEDPVTRRFVRRAVKGGRCHAYKRHFVRARDTILGVISLDATSLYPSAMFSLKQFDDIMSAKPWDM